MSIRDIIDKVLNFIILPFVAVSFILTPMTNDSRIFLGSAAIADNFYHLPYGWDAAYEVKPIGNRIINWVMYKFANEIVPFAQNHYTEFGYCVKIFALLLLIVCCYYIGSKIQIPYATPFLFIAFACQANFGIIMSEWFAALFSLVAIAMCFEKDKNVFLLVGALCFSIALLKSITGLMVIPILCSVYLLGGSIDWKRFAIGYASAATAFLLACLTIWPYSIPDMLMSRLIAHVGLYDPVTLLQWFWLTQDRSNLIQVLSFYIPIIVAGFAAAAYVAFKYYSRKEWKKAGVFALMWLAPLTIVFVQSEFIIYHYIVLMVPAIVSVALLVENKKGGWKIIAGVLTFILIGYILINSAFGAFSQYEYTFWHQKEVNADSINARFNLTTQTSILYLDPGDAPFYFHANSSCHYITPMPVERSTNEWNISYLPQYNETLNCILSYQGEYVVTDINGGQVSGFYGKGILIRSDIMAMLRENYTQVDSKSWTVYRKKV